MATATTSSTSTIPDQPHTEENARPRWRRVLYEKQPYPDWYLPKDEIATRIVAQERSLTHFSVLLAILPLTQNINVIFLFLDIFDRLESRRLHPAKLSLWCLCAIVCGSSVNAVLHRGVTRNKSHGRQRKPSQIISFAILLLLLYALSPVLKTLTEATTSDTIYPLAFLLFGLHVSLAENTQQATHTATTHLFSSALSLNAATSASLVLASRLEHNASVFALMWASILAFALFPLFVRRCVVGRLSRLGVVLVLVGWSVHAHFTNHRLAGFTKLVIATNGFLFFVVPFWMRVASRKKTHFDGPWRIATPRLKATRVDGPY